VDGWVFVPKDGLLPRPQDLGEHVFVRVGCRKQAAHRYLKDTLLQVVANSTAHVPVVGINQRNLPSLKVH